LYANADVFVHPNPREPFGIAPLEAMASGIPVVVPNRGGVLEFANSGNAWTCEPTVPAFAAATEEAIRDEVLRERRVTEALLTAERYRWENVAGEFLDLYEEFCRLWRGEPSRRAPDFTSSSAAGIQRRVLGLVPEVVKWGYRVGTGSFRGRMIKAAADRAQLEQR